MTQPTTGSQGGLQVYARAKVFPARDPSVYQRGNQVAPSMEDSTAQEGTITNPIDTVSTKAKVEKENAFVILGTTEVLKLPMSPHIFLEPGQQLSVANTRTKEVPPMPITLVNGQQVKLLPTILLEEAYLTIRVTPEGNSLVAVTVYQIR